MLRKISTYCYKLLTRAHTFRRNFIPFIIIGFHFNDLYVHILYIPVSFKYFFFLLLASSIEIHSNQNIPNNDISNTHKIKHPISVLTSLALTSIRLLTAFSTFCFCLEAISAMFSNILGLRSPGLAFTSCIHTKLM